LVIALGVCFAVFNGMIASGELMLSTPGSWVPTSRLTIAKAQVQAGEVRRGCD